MRFERVFWATLLASFPIFGLGQVVPGNWQQTFAAEFNTGQSDLNGWTYELGNNGGWGNNELQSYTSSTSNVSVSDGALRITAIKDASGNYTSGRITTNNLFSQAYGLFEFRAKLPAGQGLWPAVWMMPKDSVYGGWPTSGEIDILESKGQSSTLVQGTLHSGPAWNQVNQQTQTFEGSGLMHAGFSTRDWHTYNLSWVRGEGGGPATISWYVDGVKYGSRTGGWTIPNGGGVDAPFDQPFYFIVNMAVGGNYVGTPNLAQGAYDFQVDYIRAYQAVPEPATMAALVAGVGLILRKRKR